jgi:hypothetical protein
MAHYLVATPYNAKDGFLDMLKWLTLTVQVAPAHVVEKLDT